MLDMNHHNILENLFNNTFGKGSIAEGHAIRHKTQVCPETGDTHISIRYECAINFNPRLGLTSQKKELDADSLKALNEKVKNVKKEFKEVVGVPLKMKILDEPDSNVREISHNRDLVRAVYSRAVTYALSVSDGS